MLFSAEGVKGIRDGDVDLMGLEDPCLTEELAILAEEIKFAETFSSMESIPNVDAHIYQVRRAIHKVSRVIHKLQKSITSKATAQKRMKESNAGNKKGEKRYEYSISLLNVRKHECEINLNRALALNRRLMLLAATCQGMQLCFSETGFFTLSKSPLACILLPVDFMEEYIGVDMVTRPLEVKQGSDLWLQMRKCARVTGSTLYNALGLETFEAQKKHFAHFVKGQPKVFKEDVKVKMEYGRINEVTAYISSAIHTYAMNILRNF